MEKADPGQQYAAHLSAVVQSLEGRAASYNARKREYEALLQMLQQLPEQMSHDVMVPVAGCAFFPGSIVHTNEILVLLGENYFAERTSSQARQIIKRRLDFISENVQTIERQLTALHTRKDVINDYQREGIVDIQEEYHSDEEKNKKADPHDEPVGTEIAVQRRNIFVKAISSDKIEKSDEEYHRLEQRLAELEAEEERAEKGGTVGEGVKQVIVDSLDDDVEEEEEEEDDEYEEGEEGDAFDKFYSKGDDESVSDDEGEDVQPEEMSDEEEDTNAGKQLKPVHLRTKTPPNLSARKLKPAHVRTNTPPVTKAAAKPTAVVAEATEPIEKPKVSFGTPTQLALPPYVRPPVPPGKLKPCLAPVRPITVASPPPKAVKWVHTSDQELPKYKNKPPPQPVPAGNRPRSSARLPPPASAVTRNTAAMGDVIERAQPNATRTPAPAAAAAPVVVETGDAPKKVSRYRAALMEQRS